MLYACGMELAPHYYIEVMGAIMCARCGARPPEDSDNPN